MNVQLRDSAILFWVLWSAACGQGQSVSLTNADRTIRLEAIKSGLALRSDSPEAAAEAFSKAGVGSELERLRFELWLSALERGQVSPAGWTDYLDQGPPQDLADRARLALAQSLIDEGHMDPAWQIMAEVSENGRVRADVLRLEWSNDIRDAAAVRLANVAPLVLRNEALSLEKAAVAGLGPEEAIERAVAWRQAGHPSRGAAELRSISVRGPLEGRRRLELARCELQRGSTSAALRVLPPLSRCDGDEALVRASSWRLRGWSRFPGPTAAEAFGNCLVAAQRAVSLTGGGSSQVLEIQLECGTEAGRLEPALAAWQSLAEINWRGSRRSWLGRRLAMAMARSGRFGEALKSVASSLKDHRRCLQFAAATEGPEIDREAVAGLVVVGIPDLYALWSLDEIGEAGPSRLDLPPPIKIVDPPPTVAWLMNLGEQGLASKEWRRMAAARGVLPGEALAAAAFEGDRGRPDLGIRWLRRGFSDLGGTAMDRVSVNAVRAYLPLRWTDDLKSAAREFGLDPWLLAGLARQESIFNARAQSPAGARGVVQLMPGTARGHAVALGLGRSPDLYDPAINLRLGARELSRLIKVFGEIEPALAAYNAGESRVRRWWRQWPESRHFTEAVPIPETYTYIRRVVFLSEAYRLVWAQEWEEE
ncbi:MAG: lytic transglycosylase domain-containing protein [Acidobacteria bacterium]|nr:lytic transglycosylase domain-containing protein [Acidobacteriota bacterium]